MLDPLSRARELIQLLQLPSLNDSFNFVASKRLSFSDVSCGLVKGDNQDVLRMLMDSYGAEIDFCYIDPPYNTGSDFVFHDKRYTPEPGIWGVHAEWMGFMLPRLVLMHGLLKESGIAAISIDDYEYAQLKILMDHVFGPDNYFGTLVVHRSKNGKGSKAHIAVGHEYVLIYGKTCLARMVGLPDVDTASYNKQDEHGKYKIDGLFRKKGEASRREDRPNMFFPLYYDSMGNVFTENKTGKLSEALPIDSSGVERRWLWGLDKARTDSWRLYASAKGVVYVKNYAAAEKRVKVRSLWDDPRYLTERASNEITSIFGDRVFETPKPLGLIEDLIQCCAPPGSLILDYFAGSGTTAHAAFNVNRMDDGARRTILVEQQARVRAGSIAEKRGFQFISDITEFRLKFVAQQDSEYSYRCESID